MRVHFKESATAVVPVLAAAGAIATLFSVEMPFPAALEWSAWPHWLILASLVFTYSSVGYWLTAKLPSIARPPSSSTQV